MKMKEFLNVAIAQTQEKLDDFLFKCIYLMNPKDFSRERKMGFKQTVLFMMNMVKKSLQLELNHFADQFMEKNATISKQAYAKARQNIKPEIFMDLSNSVIQNLYTQCDDYKVWNGYRLTAIDGSYLEIPNTELLRQEFGHTKNQSSELARAKASCIYDVLNHLIIKSKIDTYQSSERLLAMDLITQLVTDGLKNDLMLFDRGYPAAEFMSFLIENHVDFAMRATKNFSNDIINAKKEDQTIKVRWKKKSYNVRVLRFPLDSGEEEIILTTLHDEKLTIKDFKELYFLRWGIETKFNDLKSKLQIENFTGATKIAIEQDFYASIYLSNMAELIRIQNEETRKEKHKGKELKYEYKINTNLLIGTLKDQLVAMLFEKSPRKRNKILKKIMVQISNNYVPIRPNRH